MTPDPTIPPAGSSQSPRASEALAIWGGPLAVATAVVFCISSAFPMVAGLTKDTSSFPQWWGVLDVATAFVLALMAFGVVGLAQERVPHQVEEATYRAYRVLIHGLFAMMVAFFVFGDRIVWINCLTGFAWRAWLLLYCLPAWLMALRSTAASMVRAG